MSIRVLNCSESIENYILCITEKIIGFSFKIGSTGDTIYISVKSDEGLVCGARAVLSDETDIKPWADGDRYKQCFTITNIEYCTPFKLNNLMSIGGQKWYLKYVQSSKIIKDNKAVELLDSLFIQNKSDRLTTFGYSINQELPDQSEESDEITIEQDDDIRIMGTFQTINFLNETDKYRGLETLVNQNFYSLFPFYKIDKSILIADNRKFMTTGLSTNITGIQGIPDALLVTFNKDLSNPFQINLIEYECYGEKKVKSIDKFNYLNGHIIPQLMRFASTFSIVTDQSIREQTVESWSNKIIDYIYDNIEVQSKVSSWIKALNPEINEQKIGLTLKSYLVSAFRTNIRIMLIIDELSSEQKDTIKNIIQSFKLETNKGIDFTAYIVRLEQKINIIDSSLEYALSFQ